MGEWARRRMGDAATLHKSHQFALPQETLKLAWPATRIRTSPVRRVAHSPSRPRLLAPRFQLLAAELITDLLITVGDRGTKRGCMRLVFFFELFVWRLDSAV